MTRYSKTMSEALEEVREASAKRDAMRAMGKNKGIDPADIDTDASDDDKKSASKNIIMQLRKSVSLKGNHSVEFASGKQKVDARIAQAVQDKFNKIKRPDDKQKFQDKIAKSYKDLLLALKEQYEMVEEDYVSEEFELEEGMKMNDPKLLKMFDKLKKGSKIKLKTSSTISQGKDYVEYIVKSKNTVNKGRVEKITLATVGNEGAVKKFLYKRDGTVGFAIGDMGASIDDIKEGTWALPDSPKAKADFKKLMSKPIKLGKEGDDASDKLYALVGDDELFDDLYVAGKKNPNGDARDVVKKHMKRLGIKEAIDPSDTGGQEEVSMAMRQVAGIRHFVDGIEMRVKSAGDMEEWYQNKLTKAHDYLETIYSYGKGDMSEEVELDETKSATGYEIFHKDFSSAMQHATAFAKSKGQPIKKDEIDNKVATGPRKPSKGKENSYTLETEKGKRWSVQVYNMGNKFELNMYLTSSHVPEGDMLDEAMATWKVTVTKPVNKLKKGDSVSVKANNIPQALKKSAKAFGDSNLVAVPSTHFDVQKEEGDMIDEAVKYQFVAIDRLGKVIGFASDEKDAKDMARRGHTMDSPSKGKGVVGRNKAKVVKLKKPMSDKQGDMMINRDFDMNKFGGETTYSVGLKEEEEPQKPDSAKDVDQGRDDKKKTRIAQLQLQIAKATETINKLNTQEK